MGEQLEQNDQYDQYDENKSSIDNRGLAILGLFMLMGALAISYGLMSMNGRSPRVTVKGYAEKNVKSDYAVWRIIVNANSTVLSETFSILKQNKERVYKFLKDNNIPNEQMGETSLFTETISNYDRNDMPTGAAKAYRMNQSIVINSKDLDKIQQLSLQINDLLSEGIDINSNPPEFYVSDLGKYKVEMLGEALKDAKLRAEAMASKTNNSIGSIADAQQGVFQITAVNSNEVSDWGINDISSIEKTIKSVVDATFFLK
ncbi:MAG TPA: SIMPL domain-containing protein [Candidatus Kapabacteria bacterium]|nr:SIMPL domain-containing protein [Candidatus Kapabacteria bacterium]